MSPSDKIWKKAVIFFTFVVQSWGAHTNQTAELSFVFAGFRSLFVHFSSSTPHLGYIHVSSIPESPGLTDLRLHLNKTIILVFHRHWCCIFCSLSLFWKKSSLNMFKNKWKLYLITKLYNNKWLSSLLLIACELKPVCDLLHGTSSLFFFVFLLYFCTTFMLITKGSQLWWSSDFGLPVWFGFLVYYHVFFELKYYWWLMIIWSHFYGL